MIFFLLAASFYLLLSFCFTEAFFLRKLMLRLKWHKLYVLEFLTLVDSTGMSVEKYMFKKMFPTYFSILAIICIVTTLSSIYINSLHIKYSVAILGSLALFFTRVYYSKFLSLLWDRVFMRTN